MWEEGLQAKSVNRWAQEIWMCWLLHTMEDGDVEWTSVTHTTVTSGSTNQTPGLYLKPSEDSASKVRCWAHSFPSTSTKKCGCEQEGTWLTTQVDEKPVSPEKGYSSQATTPEVLLRSPTTRKHTSTHAHIPEIHNGWQRTKVDIDCRSLRRSLNMGGCSKTA